MEKLEAHLSPKASREKGGSPRRLQGRGARARQEAAGPGSRRAASPGEVLPPGAVPLHEERAGRAFLLLLIPLRRIFPHIDFQRMWKGGGETENYRCERDASIGCLCTHPETRAGLGIKPATEVHALDWN